MPQRGERLGSAPALGRVGPEPLRLRWGLGKSGQPRAVLSDDMQFGVRRYTLTPERTRCPGSWCVRWTQTL